MNDGEDGNRINYLMEKFNWSYYEATEYYYYGEYDSKDWEDYE